MARYKRLYQRRRQRLLNEGFLSFEVKQLVQFALKRSYIRAMRKERRTLLRVAIGEKWSQAKFEREIRSRYVAKGFVVPKEVDTTRIPKGKRRQTPGAADTYAWLRDERRKSIERGDIDSPPPKKGSKRLYGTAIDKGDVRAQRIRYETKPRYLETKKDTTMARHGQIWIAELEKSIREEKSAERRAELEQQRQNLLRETFKRLEK